MNAPTTWTPPTPERDAQINLALVRAIQRYQARKATAAAITPPASAAQRGEQEGGSAATNRTQLRDRLGQIITIDRAGTARSISAPAAISHSRTL